MKHKRMKSILIIVCLLFAGMAMKAQDGLDRSATEVINDMAPGWNLGNTPTKNCKSRVSAAVVCPQ